MATRCKKKFVHYSTELKIQRFFEEHTQRAKVLYVGAGGRHAVFVDGSSARHGAMGWDQVQAGEDKSPEERQRTIVLYRKEAARLAEEAFHNLKEQLEDGEYLGGGEEKLDELTRLRDAARRCRRKLRKAEAKLEDDATPEEIKKLRKHDAWRRQAGEEFKRKVERIKL